MPNAPNSQPDLSQALGNDLLSAKQLMDKLGCSQATLSREVKKAGAAVLSLGKAQRTRYARLRPAGLRLPLPVTQVNERGDLQPLGALYTVGMHTGSRTAFESDEGVALFEGLPWFLSDMRPQGYLGRLFPQRLVRSFGDPPPTEELCDMPRLPPTIDDWGDDHVLQALDWAGNDEPSNLIVGCRAVELYVRQAPRQAIANEHKLERYAALAQESINANGSISSAGGEQPKFTAYVQTPSGASGDAHVIVKFSPADSGQAAERWRDLLRCEAHALQVIASHAAATGVKAAQATILQDAQRVYLEVQRFDRVGERGRLGVISLGAADDHFVGQRRRWIDAAQQLALQRLLSSTDVQHIALLQAFGLLIHNTDMHLGNISLFHKGMAKPSFELAPLYDMLPMRLRPVGQELRTIALPTVLPQADLLSVWPQAQRLAAEFVERMRGDTAISAGFKKLWAS